MAVIFSEIKTIKLAFYQFIDEEYIALIELIEAASTVIVIFVYSLRFYVLKEEF